MRERVHPGDAQAEVRVIFIGEAKAECLDAESEVKRVAFEVPVPPDHDESGQLGHGESAIHELSGLKPLSNEMEQLAFLGRHYHLDSLGKDRPLHDVAPPQDQFSDAHPRSILAVEATAACRTGLSTGRWYSVVKVHMPVADRWLVGYASKAWSF